MAVELMSGFPPGIGAQVSLANWRQAPFNRWSFNHVREIVPSADIPNDPLAVSEFSFAPVDLQSVRINPDDGSVDLQQFLEATDTDGFVVLHAGAVVYEYYRSSIGVDVPHILMSVSKSILGLMFGILQADGRIAVDQKVTEIVPEVASTAYAGATIQDLLDMRAGVAFVEDYTATQGLIIDYRKAHNWDPVSLGDAPCDLRNFYQRLTKADGRHGGAFHYVSPNTDLLGWVLERATGQRYADLVSEKLWRPMGAGRNAYITVDRLGAPRCAGGFCCTARDLARIGQVFANGGEVGGRRVVPQAWIEDIVTRGDQAAWDAGDLSSYLPGMPVHYHNKWYVLRGKKPMAFCMGVYGQNLFVDVARNLVIAKLSSQPEAMDPARIVLTMKWVEALRARFG